MRKVEDGNGFDKFNKTSVGKMFWSVNGKFPSPVEEHIDADLMW